MATRYSKIWGPRDKFSQTIFLNLHKVYFANVKIYLVSRIFAFYWTFQMLSILKSPQGKVVHHGFVSMLNRISMTLESKYFGQVDAWIGPDKWFSRQGCNRNYYIKRRKKEEEIIYIYLYVSLNFFFFKKVNFYLSVLCLF